MKIASNVLQPPNIFRIRQFTAHTKSCTTLRWQWYCAPLCAHCSGKCEIICDTSNIRLMKLPNYDYYFGILWCCGAFELGVSFIACGMIILLEFWHFHLKPVLTHGCMLQQQMPFIATRVLFLFSSLICCFNKAQKRWNWSSANEVKHHVCIRVHRKKQTIVCFHDSSLQWEEISTNHRNCSFHSRWMLVKCWCAIVVNPKIPYCLRKMLLPEPEFTLNWNSSNIFHLNIFAEAYLVLQSRQWMRLKAQEQTHDMLENTKEKPKYS